MGSKYLVLKAIVGRGIVRFLRLYIHGQIEELSRNAKDCFDLLSADSMVDESEEPSRLGCPDKLAVDLSMPIFIFYEYD